MAVIPIVSPSQISTSDGTSMFGPVRTRMVNVVVSRPLAFSTMSVPTNLPGSGKQNCGARSVLVVGTAPGIDHSQPVIAPTERDRGVTHDPTQIVVSPTNASGRAQVWSPGGCEPNNQPTMFGRPVLHVPDRVTALSSTTGVGDCAAVTRARCCWSGFAT